MKKLFKPILLLLISLVFVLVCSFYFFNYPKDFRFDKLIVSENILPDKSKEFPYYKSDLKKMNLKGEVKTFREYSYQTIDSFGKISKGERQYEEGIDYYQNRSPKGGYLTFNKNGGLIETLEYDLNNKVKEKIIFTYNENGNIIEENIFDNNDKFDYKVVFKYNDKGYLIDRSLYKNDGKLHSKFVYKYNKKDNQINKSLYFDGELDSTEDYKYDDKGNLIESNVVSYGKFINWETSFFEFDNQGNLIEESSNINSKEGSLDLITTYNYNKYGDKITKDDTTYEYVYDSQKNWIKRIEFYNGVPKFIVERKIEYY